MATALTAARPATETAMPADPRLIVALDLPTVDEARALVERAGDAVSFYKIGLQLLASRGMELAAELKRQGRQVFLDWKLHDIGATVERAAAAISRVIACAEARGSAAAVTGRPTTRWLAPACSAEAGVAARAWSSSETPDGRTPGVTTRKSGPPMARARAASCGLAITPSQPQSMAWRTRCSTSARAPSA